MNIEQNFNYRDPLMISEVYENLDKVRKEKEAKIKEQQILEAQKEKDGKYFFKNILFFTNDRDAKSNKTLKNLEAAVKDQDVTIYPFVAEEIDYKATDDKIVFNDNKNKYKITEQSNVDTIVITRLGIQESEECMELVKELQDWGFFVINPVQSAKKASNKSAIILGLVLPPVLSSPLPSFKSLSRPSSKEYSLSAFSHT